MTFGRMGEYFNIKRLPNWLAVMLTAGGFLVFSSITLGGDSRQIEVNTRDIQKIEKSNARDHKIMIDDINQLKVDVGIIAAWVQDQKNNEKN